MNEFLRFVVGELIDRPDEIVLREDERDGTVHFLLQLPQSEVGKVIGNKARLFARFGICCRPRRIGTGSTRRWRSLKKADAA